MARKTDQERLTLLLARRNRADAEIRRLKAKNEKIARAQDARRKIVAGALALEHTLRNPGSDFAQVLVRLLDEYARPHERFLFADLLPGPYPTLDGENLTDDAPIADNAGSIAASAE
jgi:hypothetical protein